MKIYQVYCQEFALPHLFTTRELAEASIKIAYSQTPDQASECEVKIIVVYDRDEHL